jgi:hypothetical protein
MLGRIIIHSGIRILWLWSASRIGTVRAFRTIGSLLQQLVLHPLSSGNWLLQRLLWSVLFLGFLFTIILSIPRAVLLYQIPFLLFWCTFFLIEFIFQKFSEKKEVLRRNSFGRPCILKVSYFTLTPLLPKMLKAPLYWLLMWLLRNLRPSDSLSFVAVI